jgi:hypothetical protein
VKVVPPAGDHGERPTPERSQTARPLGSGADAALAHRVDELLAAVCEHLPAVPARRNGDEADDGQREGEADHHAEDKSEHPSSVPTYRGVRQTEPPTETQL